jgi:histidinol dehydrogenase
MTRTSLAGLSPAAFRAVAPAAETLARAEGLGAHAESLGLRRAAGETGS